MELRGEVSSGLGRAHIFMAQPHYQEQFRKVLGVTAWPGTLNVQLEGRSLAIYIAIRSSVGVEAKGIPEHIREEAAKVDIGSLEPLRIHGFEREGRSFGGATAYASTISSDNSQEGIPCAILIPDLTRHDDVVEVIASAFLREHFDLQDGDGVVLTC